MSVKKLYKWINRKWVYDFLLYLHGMYFSANCNWRKVGKLLEHKHFCYALFAVIDKEQDVDTLKTIPRAMYRTAYLSMTELYYYFTADLMIMKQLLNCFADITKPKCVLIRTNGSILLMHWLVILKTPEIKMILGMHITVLNDRKKYTLSAEEYHPKNIGEIYMQWSRYEFHPPQTGLYDY